MPITTPSDQMSGHEYTVELRFSGDLVQPQRLSQHLNLIPSTWSAGEHDAQRNGPKGPMWGYNGHDKAGFQSEWSSLEKGFEFLLGALAPVKASVIELSAQLEGIWWCGHFQSSFDGGPTLSPHILNLIAGYQIPLFIDNYFGD